MTFLSTFAALLFALLVLAALLLLFLRPLATFLIGRLGLRTSSPYRENPAGLLPVAEKLGLLTIVELRMRAESGRPPARPMGSPRPLSPWQDLLLDFASTDPMATPDQQEVDLTVTIGPRAKRPLTLSTPVLIAAMSFGGALSLKARLALAEASSIVGTATNSGEGVFIDEERKAARHYVVQYHRGTWPFSPQRKDEVLALADAIEVQLSQGAQGPAPMGTTASHLPPEMRGRFGLPPGEDAHIASRLAGVDSRADLVRLLRRLKERHPVPVGLKLGATNRLEEELPHYLDAGIDFLVLDGAEGGTHGGPPILQEDMGLPTLWAVVRARQVLDRLGLSGEVSLIAAGGLATPGTFLKAIALGADACQVGTAIALALVADQLDASLPLLAPPYALDLAGSDLHARLDQAKARDNVVRLFASWQAEMELALRAMGKSRLTELSPADLVALDEDLATALGLSHVSGQKLGAEAAFLLH
jgi:glutamate synthase domain-containing protein 2